MTTDGLNPLTVLLFVGAQPFACQDRCQVSGVRGDVL